MGRLGETETRFYRELSPELSGLPRSYGSAFDALTGRYVLVLEDLPADECEFPTTLEPISTDRAVKIVDLLARLHATFWGRIPAWVYSASNDYSSLMVGALLKRSARRIAERTDIDVARGRFIDENYRAVATLLDATPNTVMHGDAHPGNVYFRNGEAGLLDWQAVRRGHPGRELSYTLITSMTATDRQASQRDILDGYRHALAAAGERNSTATTCGSATGKVRCTRTPPPSSPPGWVACRTKTSRWRVCGVRSRRSTISTRSRSSRSRCV